MGIIKYKEMKDEKREQRIGTWMAFAVLVFAAIVASLMYFRN